MRRSLALLAFVLALAVLVVGVVAVWTGPHINLPISIAGLRNGGPWIALRPAGPVHRGGGSASVTGVREVVVLAPTVGNVQVSTGGTRARWHWTASGPAAGVFAEQVADGVLTLTFRPSTKFSWTLGVNPDALKVELPPGLPTRLEVSVGNGRITGTYASVNADVSVGDLDVQDFRGALTGHVDVGTLVAAPLAVAGPLDLSTDTGSLTFSGDPGRASSFTVDTGTLTLQVRPSARLRVRARVDEGSLSSASTASATAATASSTAPSAADRAAASTASTTPVRSALHPSRE